jgi:hypothetical protein
VELTKLRARLDEEDVEPLVGRPAGLEIASALAALAAERRRCTLGLPSEQYVSGHAFARALHVGAADRARAYNLSDDGLRGALDYAESRLYLCLRRMDDAAPGERPGMSWQEVLDVLCAPLFLHQAAAARVTSGLSRTGKGVHYDG